MLLEDLAALIARDGAHPEALLQLDYKEDAAALTPRAIATFAAALDPGGAALHPLVRRRRGGAAASPPASPASASATIPATWARSSG